MSATAAVETQESAPCPRPIPISLQHAERCRACGKCGTIIWPPESGLAEAARSRIN